MFNIRKAIKQFKTDFIAEPDAVPSTSSLRSETSSTRTTSDDVSRYSASLTRSLRNSANGDEIPTILVGPADNFNFNEAVSPLQKRSLFQRLQHSTSLISSNIPLPSVEGGSSHEDQSKSNLTPIWGIPIPVNPMNEEFSRIAPPSSPEKRTRSSNYSNDLSTEYIHLSATPSKQVPSESLRQDSFMANLPPDPRGKEFDTESALLTSQWQESTGAHYDTLSKSGQPELGKKPKSPVDFSIHSNASSSEAINGNAVSTTPLARTVPESLSNSTPLSSPKVDDGPMESKQSSVRQTSQQSRESPYDSPVIQTTMPIAINDDDYNDQNTLETKGRLGPTPITQSLPLTTNPSLERPNSLFKRGNSITGDFPMDGPSISSSGPDSNPTSSKDNDTDNIVEGRQKPNSTSLDPFLLALAARPVTPTVVSTQVPETVEQTQTPWRQKPFRLLQPIGESRDSMSANSPSALSPDDVLAWKMEELGRIRRIESRNHSAQSKASHEATSQGPPQPVRTTATLKVELRPHIDQDSSSDVTRLLEAAYMEQQQVLQTQVDKAVAELRGMREENKRLTNENQSQHDSILKLKTALYEVKHVQDQSSIQIENQLSGVITSLTAFNKEKNGWQDKLDSMQHELSVAERQVRCLDHLTRHKLKSLQEAAYGQPKRRGLFASVLESTGIIAAMGALNKEIYWTCTQLVEGLERTGTHSTRHKLQAQKVLGVRLTAMMEDQATMPPSAYNMLLMQAVLEVFMVHWCSSIIQAFYPKQESFTDLLVQLSSRTARTSGSSAMCGKQIQIVQPSAPHTDDVKFKEWLTDIIRELDILLIIAGVRMKIHCVHLFYTKTLALIKLAYDLRIAMAEQDIHGGLEIVVVPPDAPFQEKWMLDAHAYIGTDQAYKDFIAGTSGIGLQRKVLERVNGHFQSRMNIELKPMVHLAKVLEFSYRASR